MSDPVSVTATARALGLTVGRSGSQFWISPCPACGAERRHTRSQDRRGPIGVKTNDEMWRCWQCDESGNAAWLARRAGQAMPAARAPEAIPALDFLDPAEARRFWHRCAHARARPSVAAWLDGLRLGQAFCARALPRTAYAFGWAASWEATGHHLVLGLHDATGRLRNYLARAVVPGAAKKSLAAGGVRRAGLVLADRLGVDLLRGLYTGPCVVVEGEKKLLISEHLAAGRWATIGTGSGMWSDDVAASVARASRVLVSTDPDEPGVRYARRVVSSVPACVVRPELRHLLDSSAPAFSSAEADDAVWEASQLPWYSSEALSGDSRPTESPAEQACSEVTRQLENTAENRCQDATFCHTDQTREIKRNKT